jgi:retinol dehydrogenase 12
VSNIDAIIALSRPITHVFFKTQWEGAQTTLHTALSHDVPQHNGAYFADCVPTELRNPAAYDPALTDALWETSLSMLQGAGYPVQV